MQRYFAKEYKDNLILETSDIHHIKNVMRMKEKDLIEVVYDDILYICRINSFAPFSLTIEKKIEKENKLNITLVVALALVKEQKMDLILQKLTELGVSTIIPVNMKNSIVKLDQERYKKKKIRWENICKEASEQSKRTNIPVIEDIKNIEDLVKIDSDIKLIASTKEKEKKFDYYLQKTKECATIMIVIGPEGGIDEKEEIYLCDNGFDRVSFGNLIFRVETACIYAASIINYYSSTRCD